MLTSNPIHPTSRTLVAYLDCELPVDERRDIADHLRECAGCRSELDTIEADLDWHLVLDAALLPRYAAPSAEGLTQILCATRQWRQEHPADAAAGAESRGVERQVGEALEVFFGAGAAQTQTGNAEPILSAFLGRRAATTLLEQIRNRERMERFLAPDLT